MKTIYTVRTFVRSELPRTDRVVPIMELTAVFIGDRYPSKEVVEAFVSTHVQNCKLLFSEVTESEVSDDLLPSY